MTENTQLKRKKTAARARRYRQRKQTEIALLRKILQQVTATKMQPIMRELMTHGDVSFTVGKHPAGGGGTGFCVVPGIEVAPLNHVDLNRHSMSNESLTGHPRFGDMEFFPKQSRIKEACERAKSAGLTCYSDEYERIRGIYIETKLKTDDNNEARKATWVDTYRLVSALGIHTEGITHEKET